MAGQKPFGIPTDTVADDDMAKFAQAAAFDGTPARPTARLAAAAIPSVVTVAPPGEESPVEMVQDFVLDPATGQYVEKEIPVEQAMLRFEEQDRFRHDQLWLGPEWESGRGAVMHGRWANAKAQHRQIESGKGYVPVLPKNVPDSIRKRFVVSKTVQGFEGTEVLTAGDLVLLEKPRRHHEEEQARALDNYKADEAEREGYQNRDDVRAVRNVRRDIGGVDAIDDSPLDPRDLHKQAAEAYAEAEMMASRQARGEAMYGGFQGSSYYNKTSWGQGK